MIRVLYFIIFIIILLPFIALAQQDQSELGNSPWSQNPKPKVEANQNDEDRLAPPKNMDQAQQPMPPEQQPTNPETQQDNPSQQPINPNTVQAPQQAEQDIVPLPQPTQQAEPVNAPPPQPAQQVDPASPQQVQPMSPDQPQQTPAMTQQEDPQGAEKVGPVLVGQINSISSDGEIQRYISEQAGWVVINKGYPIGINDIIASSSTTNAECIFPNNSFLRIGGNTQISVDALNSEYLEIFLTSGTARLISKGEAYIKCGSSFGVVQAIPGSVFDIVLSDTSAEIIAQKGQIIFYDTADKPHELIPGQSSLLVDKNQIVAGSSKIDSNWLAWNNKLDAAADGKVVEKQTVKHLPKELQSQGSELEGGQWVQADFNGENRAVWQPNMPADWQPYVNGQWVEYRGEQTWIANDSEPFGYITYHYGSWEYLPAYNAWCWMPPAAAGVAVGPPMWCPGRVAWVSEGEYVGWVPLSWREPYCPPYWQDYYGYYGYPGYYGPHHGYHHVDVNVTHVNINNYRYSNRAYFVSASNFHNAGGGYASFRANIDRNHFQDMRASSRFNAAVKSGRERFGSAKPASFTPRNIARRDPAAHTRGPGAWHNQPVKFGQGQRQDHAPGLPKFGQQMQQRREGMHLPEGFKKPEQQPKFGQQMQQNLQQFQEKRHKNAEQPKFGQQMQQNLQQFQEKHHKNAEQPQRLFQKPEQPNRSEQPQRLFQKPEKQERRRHSEQPQRIFQKQEKQEQPQRLFQKQEKQDQPQRIFQKQEKQEHNKQQKNETKTLWPFGKNKD